MRTQLRPKSKHSLEDNEKRKNTWFFFGIYFSGFPEKTILVFIVDDLCVTISEYKTEFHL